MAGVGLLAVAETVTTPAAGTGGVLGAETFATRVLGEAFATVLVSCTASAKSVVLVTAGCGRPGVVATPLTANVNGLVVVGSFSLKLTVAVRVPVAVGRNCTVKAVLCPAATKLLGCPVTLKSLALAPPIETLPRIRFAVPVLEIVNVSLSVLPIEVVPNAVSFAEPVVTEPLAIV